jgi:Tol biopolymer transport system component
MQTTLRLVPVPRIAWVLVVIALLIAIGVAAVAVGSHPHQLPLPFGPARNGAIVFGGSDQDIHALDPLTGATAALISGAENDRAPLMSRDGTRFVFLRDTAIADPVLGTPEPMIMVANANGSGVRSLTPALAGFQGSAWSENLSWSNDGSRVAVPLNVGGRPAIEVLAVDGSAKPIVADTGGRDGSFLAFRPDDQELVFNGGTSNGNGLFAVGADGHGLRTILDPANADYASLSPDGKELAFAVPGDAYNVIRVVDVDTGVVRTPAFVPAVTGQGEADAQSWWSPDGTRLLIQRYGAGQYQLAVAPAAGGRVVGIGPVMPQKGGQRVEAQFSPDGLRVLVHFDDGGATWLLDATGATTGTQLPSSIAEAATWQRLALAP